MKTIIIIAILLLSGYGRLLSQDAMHIQSGLTVSLQNNVAVTVSGDIVLAAGSQLINNGSLTLMGNLSDNSTIPYSYGNGVFIFKGTSNSINTPNLLQQVTLNGNGNILNSDLHTNKLYLVNGVITTGTFTLSVQDTTPSAVEADATNPGFLHSWVNGKLRRFLPSTSIGSYFFPVGNHLTSLPAQLSNFNPDAGLHYVEMVAIPKQGNDAGLTAAEAGDHYFSVSPETVWNIVSDVPSSVFDLSLYFNGFTGLTDNSFAILQRPIGSTVASDWVVPTGSLLNAASGQGRLVSDSFALRKNIQSFGQFGIGKLSVALPVKLTLFNATRVSGNNVELNWETAMEQNNKGFILERRLDNETVFHSIASISSKAPSGNSSNPLAYQYNDMNAFTGTSYYRLEQVDFDGHSSFSLVKSVNGLNNGSVTLMIWPNPAAEQFNIRLNGAQHASDVIVTNSNGQVVRRVVLENNGTVIVSNLAPGVYTVTVVNRGVGQEIFSQKVFLNR